MRCNRKILLFSSLMGCVLVSEGWSKGFYLGPLLGYSHLSGKDSAMGTDNTGVTGDVVWAQDKKFNADNFLAAGLFGWGYTYGQARFGVEGSFGWHNLSSRSVYDTPNEPGDYAISKTENPWDVAFAGHVGYAPNDSWVFAGRVGVGIASFSQRFEEWENGAQVYAQKETNTRVGYLLGAFVEKSWERWSLRLDYTFADYGKSKNNFNSPQDYYIKQEAKKLMTNTVSLGALWRF